MEDPLKWLVIGELIIIGIIVLAKFIFDKLEDRKIDKVIKFLDKKTRNDKEAKDKLKECLKIIEQNQIKGE